jgi:hypothetical protein
MTYDAKVTRLGVMAPRSEARNCVAGDVTLMWTEFDAVNHGA